MQHHATTTRALLGVVAACFLSLPAYADDTAPPLAPPPAAQAAAHIPLRAQLLTPATPDTVRHMADWVTDSADNRSLPFVIIDKPDAKVFVFDKNGILLGSAWALVGLAQGDDSVPGIGTMPLTAITPDMRTTPAGRFVAALGHDLGKLDVLWVDYSNAISLHRVINTNLAERRLERIVSPAPADHRISYGCINVPAAFFDSVVDPAFKGTKGIVYILPEVKMMHAVFPAYHDVDGNAAPQAIAQAGSPVSATPAAYQQNPGSVEGHDLPAIVH
ncbi:MAG TPA: hypothetical protein VNW15_02385 [Rhizomicrobium sp.]|nr:hypothetical protein [Rhizomicrobium sp.]